MAHKHECCTSPAQIIQKLGLSKWIIHPWIKPPTQSPQMIPMVTKNLQVLQEELALDFSNSQIFQ